MPEPGTSLDDEVESLLSPELLLEDESSPGYGNCFSGAEECGASAAVPTSGFTGGGKEASPGYGNRSAVDGAAACEEGQGATFELLLESAEEPRQSLLPGSFCWEAFCPMAMLLTRANSAEIERRLIRR